MGATAALAHVATYLRFCPADTGTVNDRSLCKWPFLASQPPKSNRDQRLLPTAVGNGELGFFILGSLWRDLPNSACGASCVYLPNAEEPQSCISWGKSTTASGTVELTLILILIVIPFRAFNGYA